MPLVVATSRPSSLDANATAVLRYAPGADEAAIGALTIRRVGTEQWKTLGSAPAAGARGPIQFSDPDCAFDIRATGAGGKPVTWAGVNLCDVKSVILKSDGSAGAWVDYDQ